MKPLGLLLIISVVAQSAAFAQQAQPERQRLAKDRYNFAISCSSKAHYMSLINDERAKENAKLRIYSLYIGTIWSESYLEALENVWSVGRLRQSVEKEYLSRALDISASIDRLPLKMQDAEQKKLFTVSVRPSHP